MPTIHDPTEFVTALEEFTPELLIDKHRLDEEIAKQGDLYYRVSMRAAEAMSIRDRLKQQVSMTEAESATIIRREAVENDEKLTEAKLKEQITIDQDVKSAVDFYLRWDRIAREWQAMQAAMEQRSRMLREMAQLYVAGYFVTTSAGDAKSNYDEKRSDEGRRALTERRRLRDDTSRARIRS